MRIDLQGVAVGMLIIIMFYLCLLSFKMEKIDVRTRATHSILVNEVLK